MEQFLAHLVGDYIFQNDNVGTRKKERSLTGLQYCLFHCALYGLVFLSITNWVAALLIAITHFIVDRWKIVDYLIAFKNNVYKPIPKGYECLIKSELDISNFGYNSKRPIFMSAWLYIIQDNILHLVINYFILKYDTHIYGWCFL